MQFLKVYAKDRGSDSYYTNGIPVLINEQQNGTTGQLLKLDEGIIEVTVDHELADVLTVDLKNTTVKKPLEVVVSVGGQPLQVKVVSNV
jgi:hypothetical protein